jgi:hypothetical protein
VPPEGIRPAYEPLRLEEARFEASERSDLLPALHDGSHVSAWRTTREQEPGEWVQVEFPEPVLVGRVELWPGGDRSEAGEELQLLAALAPGAKLSIVNPLPGRPPIEQQRPGEPSQCAAGPVKLKTPRITQNGRKPRPPWAIAELRIDRVVASAPPPPPRDPPACSTDTVASGSWPGAERRVGHVHEGTWRCAVVREGGRPYGDGRVSAESAGRRSQSAHGRSDLLGDVHGQPWYTTAAAPSPPVAEGHVRGADPS